jgi:hypothetical protein
MGERGNMPIKKELATIIDLETGARVTPSDPTSIAKAISAPLDARN